MHCITECILETEKKSHFWSNIFIVEVHSDQVGLQIAKLYGYATPIEMHCRGWEEYVFFWSTNWPVNCIFFFWPKMYIYNRISRILVIPLDSNQKSITIDWRGHFVKILYWIILLYKCIWNVQWLYFHEWMTSHLRKCQKMNRTPYCKT